MFTALNWIVRETGLRFLRRRKAAASVAVLTLALALGANTTAFAVVNAFLLNSFAVPEPSRLFAIVPVRELPGRGSVQFSDAYPNYQVIREANRSFDEVAAFVQSTAGWDHEGEVRPLQASRVTATFFRTMRVQPVIGQVFDARAEGPSPTPVVLISDALWRGSLSGDPGIVGKHLTINGTPHTVIGVMPPGFTHPLPTDVWLPFSMSQVQLTSVTGARILTIYARLRDGVPPNAADMDIATFTKRTLEANAVDNRDYRYTRTSFRELLLPGVGRTVRLVQFAALILVSLAIVNLASLLVAWGFDRQSEMATRLALGARSSRLVRLAIMQSVVVVAAGAVGGLVFGALAVAGLKRLEVTRAIAIFFAELRVDLPVIFWSVLVALAAGVLAGLLPGWLQRRLSVASTLRSSSRGASLTREALRWQKGIVGLQAGLSVVILIGATLLGLSLRNLTSVPMGFSAGDRVVARIQLPEPAYSTHPARAALARRLDEALALEPELESVGLTSTLPIGDQMVGARFFVDQPDGSRSAEALQFHIRRVSPNYLGTLGVPLLQGRLLEARDDSSHPTVAVVSKALADRMWPNANPIGKRLLRVVPGNPTPAPVEVVGVVADVRDAGNTAPLAETVYVPLLQNSSARLSLLFTPRGVPANAIAAIRRVVRAADPTLTLSGIAPLTALEEQADSLARLRAMLVAIFGVVALAIAVLGAYGVMSQLTANREREFALRLVFGARPISIGSTVVLQALRLTIPGIVAGCLAVWFSSSAVRPFMFQVDARSVELIAVVALAVAAATALTALAPAWRALRIRPDRALTDA